MTMFALSGTCDIMGTVLADPEVENSVDHEAVIFAAASCTEDPIIRQRSVEARSSGGEPGIHRTTFMVQDARLNYPVNFTEANWIRYQNKHYNITTIKPAIGSAGVHHYEIDAETGVDR
jgi:hypothetical protein